MSGLFQGDLTGKKFKAKKGGGWIWVKEREDTGTLMKDSLKWVVHNDEGQEWLMTDSVIRSRIGRPGKKQRPITFK